MRDGHNDHRWKEEARAEIERLRAELSRFQRLTPEQSEFAFSIVQEAAARSMRERVVARLLGWEIVPPRVIADIRDMPLIEEPKP